MLIAREVPENAWLERQAQHRADPEITIALKTLADETYEIEGKRELDRFFPF